MFYVRVAALCYLLTYFVALIHGSDHRREGAEVFDAPNLPSSEIETLNSLYDSTDGPNWAWTTTAVRWNFSASPNPCYENWYGVQCTATATNGYLHVEQLVLSEWNLRGTLPGALGNLEQMTDLHLSTNHLTGTLPSELSHLTSLQSLVLNANSLTGPVPLELGMLTELRSLDLEVNHFTGTIPAQLGNLTQLLALDLYGNSLSGTVPPALGYLPQLELLDLNTNALTGSLPPALGKLLLLLELSVFTNQLTGSLPPQLCNLAYLEYIDLLGNRLSGPIPSGLGNLTQLRYFDLSSNMLTGTIPPELGDQMLVQYFDLGTNILTGTIPHELSQPAQMLVLDLLINRLTGTVPLAVSRLTQLLVLDLAFNQLTGTIPLFLSNLTLLNFLDLDGNHFTGTFPPALCDLSQLQLIDVRSNLLTGTLPPQLGNLAQLRYLDASYNTFTSTLASEVSALARLQYLGLYGNFLTGTLPPEMTAAALPAIHLAEFGGNFFEGTILDAMFAFPQLQYVGLSYNLFTGTLSSDLSNATSLLYVSVAYNNLWGCLPSVRGIRTLQEIDVSHNKLHCSLADAFSGADGLVDLLDVQVQNNKFTGTLPAVLFSLPKLQTLVAVSNCFTGTLPQEICQATALQSLILDGIGASRSCPTVWTTWQREGQLRIPNRFHGTIPGCVFSLPELTSLHLSGNNLFGNIPNRIKLDGNLTQLYLSHNMLTGTIPEAVQTHSWDELDLSYNRFSGSLLPSFGEGTLQGPFNATASVVVNNSRLSGEIPATVLQLPQVSILGTNMFSCKADKSEVPNTDGNGDKQRYQCGSDSFNYAFYLFLSMVGTAAVALFLMWRVSVAEASNRVSEYLTKWHIAPSDLPPSCKSVFAMISVLSQLAMCCCVPLVLVLVPWYGAASHYYGTYTHQYAWVVSAAFLSGLAPGLVEFFLWAGIVTLVLWMLYNRSGLWYPYSLLQTPRSSIPSGSHEQDPISLRARVQAYTMFLSINLAVVIGVNVAFVYISLNESSEAVLLAQVALSLFKFGWNTACVPYLIDVVSERFMPSRRSAGYFRVQAFVGLFNNIAIPCFAVVVQSPACFRDLIFLPDAVTSVYVTQECEFVYKNDKLQTECTFPNSVAGQSSFTPRFSYSYECSSSFVTYYSAAMVYFAMTAAVLVPAVRLLLCWVVHCTPAQSRVHKWSNMALPVLWRVPAAAAGACTSQEPNRGLRYINAGIVLVNMTVYLGILLSFGVVFPPVALAMCVAMLSTAYQTSLAVGRLLSNAREVGAQHVVEAVERDCKGVASLEKLQSVIVMAIVFACYFYPLFIFDTIGDAEGFAGACWVLVLWVVVPLCAAAYSHCRQYSWSAELGSSARGRGCANRPPSLELVGVQDQPINARTTANVGMGEVEEAMRQAGAQASEVATVSALHV